jgi:hypothetical protein
MPTYFISGHLSLSRPEFLEYYKPKLDEALRDLSSKFVVGDARGTDTLAQEYLFSSDAEVTVFHMFENPRNNVGNHRTRGGYTSDKERDKAMTAASDADIAWIRPGRESSGTAKNLARRSK